MGVKKRGSREGKKTPELIQTPSLKRGKGRFALPQSGEKEKPGQAGWCVQSAGTKRGCKEKRKVE